MYCVCFCCWNCAQAASRVRVYTVCLEARRSSMISSGTLMLAVGFAARPSC